MAKDTDAKIITTKDVTKYPEKVLPGDEVVFQFNGKSKYFKDGQEKIMHRVRALDFEAAGKGKIVRDAKREVRTPNRGVPKK